MRHFVVDCFTSYPSASAPGEKKVDAMDVTLAHEKDKCGRSRAATGHQSRFPLIASASPSRVTHGFRQVATQTTDRRAKEQTREHWLPFFRAVESWTYSILNLIVTEDKFLTGPSERETKRAHETFNGQKLPRRIALCRKAYDDIVFRLRRRLIL